MRKVKFSIKVGDLEAPIYYDDKSFHKYSYQLPTGKWFRTNMFSLIDFPVLVAMLERKNGTHVRDK